MVCDLANTLVCGLWFVDPISMVCDLANTMACDLDLWVVVYGPWINGLWSVTLAHMV